MSRPLDFLIIGAQKCATTTLFEHLRAHPDIVMPLEKEVPFFTAAETSGAAWDAYAERHFGARAGLRGKATPQYMADPGVAERIRQLMPDVKLVAILRDPVQRTVSHYQMARRRNTEAAELPAAIESLLREDNLERGRRLPAPPHTAGYEPESAFYVAWSEYGRVLQQYHSLFGPEQLLVLYTEDLERDPAGTLDKLLTFIGLPAGFRPDSLGEVLHRGGSGNRIPHGVRVWLRERRLVYRLWQAIPAARRGRLRFLYEQWNVRRRDGAGHPLPEATRQALTAHFAADLALLRQLPVAQPPWALCYGIGAAP